MKKLILLIIAILLAGTASAEQLRGDRDGKWNHFYFTQSTTASQVYDTISQNCDILVQYVQGIIDTAKSQQTLCYGKCDGLDKNKLFTEDFAITAVSSASQTVKEHYWARCTSDKDLNGIHLLTDSDNDGYYAGINLFTAKDCDDSTDQIIGVKDARPGDDGCDDDGDGNIDNLAFVKCQSYTEQCAEGNSFADCDDGDNLEHHDSHWAVDEDGDGYVKDRNGDGKLIACTESSSRQCSGTDYEVHVKCEKPTSTSESWKHCSLIDNGKGCEGNAVVDCDDGNHAVSPSATELCNNRDDNCNGQTDEVGGTGIPDADACSTSCTITNYPNAIPSELTNFELYLDSQPRTGDRRCCADDGEDNIITYKYKGVDGKLIEGDGSSAGCCASNTACVYEKTCYDSGSVFDVGGEDDLEYCGQGNTWYDVDTYKDEVACNAVLGTIGWDFPRDIKIAGANGKCCGDDLNEKPIRSRASEQAGSDTLIAWHLNNIVACCDKADDLVDPNGECVEGQTEPRKAYNTETTGNDIYAYPQQNGGTWLECDLHTDLCSNACGGSVPTKSGELENVGEYLDLTQEGCCGDDGSEKKITASFSYPDKHDENRCCDSSTDQIAEFCLDTDEDEIGVCANPGDSKILCYTTEYQKTINNQKYSRKDTATGNFYTASGTETDINSDDNCPSTANTNQKNIDGDAQGDACDEDDDNDGVIDSLDNCQVTANGPSQGTCKLKSTQLCMNDMDCTNSYGTDSAQKLFDKCSKAQEDLDEDGLGDACDNDDDEDQINDAVDNCPFVYGTDNTASLITPGIKGYICDNPKMDDFSVEVREDEFTNIFKNINDVTGFRKVHNSFELKKIKITADNVCSGCSLEYIDMTDHSTTISSASAQEIFFDESNNLIGRIILRTPQNYYGFGATIKLTGYDSRISNGNTLDDIYANTNEAVITVTVLSVNDLPVISAGTATNNGAQGKVLLSGFTASDFEDGTIALSYEFKLNDITHPSSTPEFNCAINSCARGNVIEYTVKACDNSNACVSQTDTISISDTPPTAPTSVTITPETAYKNTLLTATAQGATDIDSDTITYEYEWYKGSELIATAPSLNCLSAQQCLKNSVLTVKARAVTTVDRSSVKSAAIDSTQITIQNTEPTLSGSMSVTATDANGNGIIGDTDDSFTCDVAGVTFNDADGPTDINNKLYEFTQDQTGIKSWSGDSTLLCTATGCNKGTITCSLKAVDNSGAESNTLTATAEVLNTPPTLPASLSLTPKPGKTNSAFTATYTRTGNDADGDIVEYWYRWSYQLTTLQDWTKNANTYTCDNTKCQKDGTVKVELKTRAGNVDSTNTLSDSSLIQNTAPTLSGSISVTATDANGNEIIGDTDDSFTCDVAGVDFNDADGPADINKRYKFAQGSSVIRDWEAGETLSCALPGCNKGTITCSLKAVDNSGAESNILTAPAEVLNTPPTAPTVTIAPETAYKNTLLTATAVSSDIDNDALSYHYHWYYIDDTNTEQTVVGWGPQNSFDCASSAVCIAGRTIYVKARAHDGNEYSQESTPASIAIQNTLPTLTITNPTPSKLVYGDTLTVDYSGADPDTSDTIQPTLKYDFGSGEQTKTCTPITGRTTAGYSGACTIDNVQKIDLPNFRITVEASDGKGTTAEIVEVNLDNSCNCNSKQSCKDKLERTNFNCNEIKLTNDITIGVDETFLDKPAIVSGRTFNCDGKTVSGSHWFAVLNRLNGITIKNCIIKDFNLGIYVSNSANMNIEHNQLTNIGTGIYFSGSSLSNIHANDINANLYGIISYPGTTITIEENKITTTLSQGIGLELSNTQDSTVASNIVNSLGTAIRIFDVLSCRNKIYNNDFTGQVTSSATSCTNYFNQLPIPGQNIIGGQSIGGNYWHKIDNTGFSDTCADRESDGICDSSFVILAGLSVDQFPLKKQS